jgi:hypothetical protein
MPFSVLEPTGDLLKMFREELWKERRLLEVIQGSGDDRLLRKHFENRGQVESELRNLSALREQYPTCVPIVLADAERHIDLQYIEGARIYTVLEMLKTIEAFDENAGVARQNLLNRCVGTCSQVQRVLAQQPVSGNRKCYPLRRKLLSLLSLFDHCLALRLNLEELDAELDQAESFLDRLSCSVPFRDATPKNLILAWPEIWPGRSSPGQQLDLLRDAMADLSLHTSSPLAEAPILNIDFSSCDEFTVPEDDPISLLFHEPSWFGGLPSAEQLLWLGIEPAPARLAIGLAIRMYRLGGRRLSYRLVHANGYRARYSNESIAFHFRCLIEASDSTCADLRSRFPALLDATRAILSRLDEGLYTSTDWFEPMYGSQPSRYYRDVYPY